MLQQQTDFCFLRQNRTSISVCGLRVNELMSFCPSCLLAELNNFCYENNCAKTLRLVLIEKIRISFSLRRAFSSIFSNIFKYAFESNSYGLSMATDKQILNNSSGPWRKEIRNLESPRLTYIGTYQKK